MQSIKVGYFFCVCPDGFHLENPLNKSMSWWMNFKLFCNKKNNHLADCLAENKFLLKLAYLCDIFAKLNKLNISMQGMDKNMLDERGVQLVHCTRAHKSLGGVINIKVQN